MIVYKKGVHWNKAKTNEMLAFENETGKNAVYNNKITGNFEYWLWMKEKAKIKGIKKLSIKEFIISKYKVGSGEFWYLDTIKEHFEKAGYSEDDYYDWKYNVSINQKANHKFITKDFVIITKGGVMGTRGFNNKPQHAKLSFYYNKKPKK